MTNKRICIFCGSGSLTKEHVWPSWSEPLIRNAANVGRNEDRYTVSPGKVRPMLVSRREIPEAAIDKQMKVVCGVCNNGWMSDIENAAKPIMTLMILGRSCDLDVFAQRQVANWATLKMMVAEQNETGNIVTSQQQRDHFRDRRAIPDQTNIYIAKCGEGGWDSAYWRITETVSDSLENRPNGPNTHSVTLGIGKLLIHISHSSMPKLHLSLVVNDPTLVLHIWPLRAPVLRWPPRRGLRPEEARVLADTLSNLTNSPNVR